MAEIQIGLPQHGRQMQVWVGNMRFSTGQEVSGSDAVPPEICHLIMTALRSRCGHYIFVMCFFFLLMAALCNRGWALYFCFVVSSIFLCFFFSRLISAVADWMSTIRLHMMWPKCEFRMQI